LKLVPGQWDPRGGYFPLSNGEKFMLQRIIVFVTVSFLFTSTAFATIFGAVRGVVHDPQHRPIAGASVKLKSATSDSTQTALTDQDGAFSFSAVPVGDYLVTVTMSGFGDDEQAVTVVSDSSPALHF
jgi:hypothetical protein